MDVLEKLTILTDAAKYDAACTSSGGSRVILSGRTLCVAAEGPDDQLLRV